MKQCRNCQTTFEGNFCPSCGQKDVDLERALGELVGEVLRETLDVDGRAWRTIRTLFLRPGELTSEYLLGRKFPSNVVWLFCETLAAGIVLCTIALTLVIELLLLIQAPDDFLQSGLHLPGD